MAVKEVDAYIATVERLEPNLHPVDLTAAAASIAVSLRRLADEAVETNRLLRIQAQAAVDLVAQNVQPGSGWGNRG